MKLFDVINLLDSSIRSADCKLHMAIWNGEEHPIDVYLADDFEEWQRWQKNRNFERPYVVSLINLPGTDNWLFVGVFERVDIEYKKDLGYYYYSLNPLEQFEELEGRLVVTFSRKFRQSYLLADRWCESIHVCELKPERIALSEFPGFKSVNLSKRELDAVIRQNIASWRGALGSVSGVYVIADTKSGKLYVGSAYGEGGLWARWAQYSSSGHGNNVELRRLLKELGTQSAEAFRFSILEVADIHTSKNEVLSRESHWKNILLSRTHGYNAT